MSVSRRAEAAAWVALGLSVGVYAAVWLVWREPFFVGLPRLRSFDLDVYRGAALAVLHGQPLYRMRVYGGMRFTYPPFTALVLVGDRLLRPTVDAAVVAAINLVMLLAILRLTPRLHSGRDAVTPARAARWGVVALAAALLIWCEPVSVCLGYGQIDLLVTLLIVADLARPVGSRGRGCGVGLAAGLKLTPLLFIPYLLLSRDRRAAAGAGATFVATVAIGWLVLPSDSASFWDTGVFMNSGRTGDTAAPINQSLGGAISRATHLSPAGGSWTPLLVAVAVACLALAVVAARRGEPGVGVAVCALASLLVSPVSWTHHWVLAIPAVGLLWPWAWRRREWPLLVATTALAAAAWCYLPELIDDHMGFNLDLAGQIAADPYVILALATIVAAAVAIAHRRRPTSARAPEVVVQRGSGVAAPAIRSGQL